MRTRGTKNKQEKEKNHESKRQITIFYTKHIKINEKNATKNLL